MEKNPKKYYKNRKIINEKRQASFKIVYGVKNKGGDNDNNKK